jgi:LEA14-like dessication related protein
MKPLYYLLGGIAALWAYSYFKLAKSINFTFKSIGISGGLISPAINIKLGLQNPSSQSAQLISIAGSIFINEKYLGNFSNFNAQNIAANSESDVTITVKPNLLGTTGIIRDFIKNRGKGQINVKLEGTANIDGNAIKFEQFQAV